MLHLTFPSIDIRDFLSISSLIISAFTLYWNILRGVHYVSPPLRWIIFGLLPQSNTLVINFPIAITNIGSCSGVIDSFYIELMELSTSKTERFYAYHEGKITGQELNGFGMEVPMPVSLKAGESTVKHYTFVPSSPGYVYTCGLHKLSLYAYPSGNKKIIKLYQQILDIESVLEPQPYQNIIPIIWSYNLFPKKILKISNYGNNAQLPSIIETAKN